MTQVLESTLSVRETPVRVQGLAGQLAQLTAVGTAVPPESYSQAELVEAFGITDPRIRSLFANSAIERRHLVLPPTDSAGRFQVECQGALLAKHRESGLAMAAQALLNCLAESNAELSDVKYLCCVTSTGFLTPGFSALLIRELGLSRHCSRLDVVGMGCNAGLNALAAVTGWASAHPGQLAIMVCVEACSAAYVFDGTMRTAVVNSLFGDGAAAVSVLAGSQPARGSGIGGPAGPAVLGTSSCIIPDAMAAMRYDWDDEQQKFSFFIDPEVPYVVGAYARRSVDRLLAGTGLHRSDIAHWLVHSGGKKVIDAVRVNLGLTREDVRHTMGILRDYGNLSSASFLFSYQRLVAEHITRPGDYGVMMTMGPGSTIELALLQW